MPPRPALTQRDALEDGLLVLLVNGGRHVRGDEARRDGVAGDGARRKLARGGLRGGGPGASRGRGPENALGRGAMGKCARRSIIQPSPGGPPPSRPQGGVAWSPMQPPWMTPAGQRQSCCSPAWCTQCSAAGATSSPYTLSLVVQDCAHTMLPFELPWAAVPPTACA